MSKSEAVGKTLIRMVLGFSYFFASAVCAISALHGETEQAIYGGALGVLALVALAYLQRETLQYPAYRLRFVGGALGAAAFALYGTIGFNPGLMAIAGALILAGILIYLVGLGWSLRLK